ncbi:uncharacterized protein LOC133817728 [Humulus lupulus]|uniref:uncharacterized protein LOC133817728 n=1 Tax=Humulus lupulus TaxID=3486 RepID=UPI002B411DB9|nr:uncharacterized protein LOC133817728 [Humulus lupulus]
MGKTMDALLGKNFKTSKFKNLVELVSSRIAVLEKQHRFKCMQAQSDVVSLLRLGHQESAFLRVELVITEQDMMDAYSMIENFCHLLVERVVLIENNREVPHDLKEAISSLIFAASKCGEAQELEKISRMFIKRFGKEFAQNAVNLCNYCGVCPKIVSKLSTERPRLETKLIMLKEIAFANGIDLHIEGEETMVITEGMNLDRNEKELEPRESANDGNEQNQGEINSEKAKLIKKYRDFKASDIHEVRHGNDHLSINEKTQGENIPEDVMLMKKSRDPKVAGDDCLSIKEQKQGDRVHDQQDLQRSNYTDFKAAAQAAYKLASHAAVTARAAVELAQPSDKGPDDRPRKSIERKILTQSHECSKSDHSVQGNEVSEKKSHNNELETQKNHVKVISSSSSEREKIETNSRGHLKGD